MKLLCSVAVLSSFALAAENVFITVDQFGYRPADEKVAVLKDPQKGFDAGFTYTPGATINVVDASSGKVVFSGAPEFHKGNDAAGIVDTTSGDKVWWFDFSQVSTAGSYYIQDAADPTKKSYTFDIREDVYNDVLKTAVRMLYYQRVGIAKEAQYAGAEWADAVNHPQDKNARRFMDSTNVSAERDVSGGWFDAGDYNKYTVWNGNYIETLLQAYWERPKAFTDDYNIPESGNGIPDIVDEAKWGLDHLLRMQNADGSVLSVVGESHENASGGVATPPSTAAGRSYYGDANALSAYSATKAFAIGAKISQYFWGEEYTAKLKNAAISAFEWAEAHPDSLFFNNDESHGTKGLAAGQQEENITEDDKKTNSVRLGYRLAAALRLYDLTGEAKYIKLFVEVNGYNSAKKNYQMFPLMNQYWRGDQYRHAHHRMFLLYLSLANTAKALGETDDAAIRQAIQEGFLGLLEKNDFTGGPDKDGYRSYIRDYNWGSNSAKSSNGVLFELLSEANIAGLDKGYYRNYAEDYVHYIHGVNPLGYVYLSNMESYGAENSVPGIYHEWFHVSSEKWAFAKAGSVGPAPGYLTGGPNSRYAWNACCDQGNTGCGSASNHALCLTQERPVGQPVSKMYDNVTRGWPLDGYKLTEPSIGYQVNFIHLLSKFVEERGASLGENEPAVLPGSSSALSESSSSVANVTSSSAMQIISSSAAKPGSSSSATGSTLSSSAAQNTLAVGVQNIKNIAVLCRNNVLAVETSMLQPVKVQIFDMMGNVVEKRVLSSRAAVMPLDHLSKGYYVARVTQGMAVKTSRIQVR